jgi:hypothetical protein
VKIITDLEPRAEPLHLTPQAAVALFVATLERDGALFTLKPDGTFLCDLNGIAGHNHAKAEAMSRFVLGLRDEIRAELIARRITH